jgi:hypothetical protein
MLNTAKIYSPNFKNFQQNKDAENKITALYLRLSREDEQEGKSIVLPIKRHF